MSRTRKTIGALLVAAGAATAVATGAIGLPAPDAPACRFFPRSNPWNQRVDSAPVDRRSSTYIRHLGSERTLLADFSIPYTTVPKSQRRVPVRFYYRDESDRGPYPIPPDAPVEGGTPDRHVLVLERGNCRLYELYKARRIAGGKRWRAGSGAVWNLRRNDIHPRGWTSADAAGLPILPGLARFDELERGGIDHAIRFTARGVRNTYVYPARHSDGRSHSRNAPPMGSRFRLRPDFDVSGFPPQSRAILQALKRYGMILADSGDPYLLSGAPSSGWDHDDLESLRGVKGDDLQVVDTRRLPKPGR